MRTEKKRRMQNKTDYKARMKMLKSGIPRVVIRRTNRYIIIQVVKSIEAKDKVEAGISSQSLLKNGWDKKFEGSLKSIPAAYVTGLLIAKKMKKGDYILDMGLARHKPNSRIYAAARGIVDGGINLRVNKDVFPSDDMINGKNSSDEMKAMLNKLIGGLK